MRFFLLSVQSRQSFKRTSRGGLLLDGKMRANSAAVSFNRIEYKLHPLPWQRISIKDETFCSSWKWNNRPLLATHAVLAIFLANSDLTEKRNNTIHFWISNNTNRLNYTVFVFKWTLACVLYRNPMGKKGEKHFPAVNTSGEILWHFILITLPY